MVVSVRARLHAIKKRANLCRRLLHLRGLNSEASATSSTRLRSDMSPLICLIGLVIFVWSPAPTLSDDSLPCYDGTDLLPFVVNQITRGSRLIVYQGTAAPQV